MHYLPEPHLLGDALGQGWFLLPCYSQGGLINSTGSAPLPLRVAAAEGSTVPPWTRQVVEVVADGSEAPWSKAVYGKGERTRGES